MSKALQAVRGMNDLLPEALRRWRRVEDTARSVFESYGFREIRFPILESTELYARSIGEVTDIVEKEMFSFEDRNGDSLSLRPEGTAGCVRAGINNGLLHNQIQRFWYSGPMFRHEKPQRGRYRQFHQIGIEVFGASGPDIDAELIVMMARLFRELQISDLRLEINSLGTSECRAAYRARLVEYFRDYHAVLDEDSRRRLEKNPLRILDSKNPALRDIIARAPSLLEALDADSRAHFEQLKQLLDGAGIRYEVNPRLVRGLDYYSRTVFEWITTALGAQGTVCAGGRYDGLVAQLGGQATPAVGFALGIERLVELLEQAGLPGLANDPQVYLVLLDTESRAQGLLLAEKLRSAGLRVEADIGGGSIKSQMKRADRSAAQYALILGETERQAGKISVKALRSDNSQEELDQQELVTFLSARLA